MTKKADSLLGCISKHTTSRLREVILYSAVVRPHTECCVQFQPPQHKRNTVERVQRKVTKIIKAVKHPLYG